MPFSSSQQYSLVWLGMTIMGDAAVASVENKLEDLSGLVLRPGENPYAALIKACNDDPVSALFSWTLC